MPDAASKIDEQEEFWKPVVATPPQVTENEARPACRNCGTNFLIGSRFCYICGTGRHIGLARRSAGLRGWLDLGHLIESLEQNLASLVALVLGSACVVAAIVTGFFYTATTLLDWQAVQIWRIEWLLGAIALFTAGILVRKK
jgi:hypothetical protein